MAEADGDEESLPLGDGDPAGLPETGGAELCATAPAGPRSSVSPGFDRRFSASATAALTATTPVAA
ncbi:hypothetical protein [Streptomyces mayonensis]|uniref:hypothetical protein n=1 Tax=Streptomyces mayonensis TaxID=2750816 RepID=UPI0020A65DDD|nr:hypothetical protein [Streptomyces sp. A108]